MADAARSSTAAAAATAISLASVDAQVQRLASNALAPNSHKAVNVAERSFFQFCELFNIRISPEKGISPLAALLGVGDDDQTLHSEASQCLQAVEAELLLHDIYFGASILPPGRRPSDVPPFRVDNYPVAPQVAAGITSAISGELAAGRIQRVSYVPAHLTPIYGKEEPEKIRIITDFSAPRGLALNDQTDAMHFSMMSHQDAFALLRPGSYMAKLDISKAYRTVGVRPSQWHLLGPSAGKTHPRATLSTILILVGRLGTPKRLKSSAASLRLSAP